MKRGYMQSSCIIIEIFLKKLRIYEVSYKNELRKGREPYDRFKPWVAVNRKKMHLDHPTKA
ncbi:MAG: hypothetical protein BGO43_04350 [Gammaproteobacteria bacterium 39-13]|nr:MAG: hypothetical protein BGO43_04350 [Gammaproteobacteria bacterium 39-13]